MIKTLTDTIHKTVTIIDTVKTSSASSLDLINKVDSFYNNAWIKLTTTVTIFFILVGVIVPLIIQWYQKRELRLSEEKLKAEINSKFDESIKELRSEIREEYDIKLEQLEQKNISFTKDLTKNYSKIIGAVQFSLQGSIASSAQENEKAIYNYLKCLKLTLDLPDSGNAGRLIKLLKVEMLFSNKPKIDKFLSIKPNITFTDMIKQLEGTKLYTKFVDEIQTILDEYNSYVVIDES